MLIWVLWFWIEWKSTYNRLVKNWTKKENIVILDENNNKNYLENLDEFDLIYKSPWISIYKPEIKKVLWKITSQAEYFFNNFKWKIILISWSKWKSTTSTLLYKILKKSWKNVKLVWNIWNPIFDEIDFNNQPDYTVFEISSYMLDSTPNVISDYSILTNIYNVHTNWHFTHENYKKAKFKLLNSKYISSVSTELFWKINNKKNIVRFWEWTKYFFDKNFIYWKRYQISIDKIKLWWEHNYKNIASILPILEKENIQQKHIEDILFSFWWLEHRQEFIWEINNVKYYNDSIATIPESVIQALNRFSTDIDTIILWWQDSWFNYDELIDKINNLPLKNVILLPNSLDNFANRFINKNVIKVNNMFQAVKNAKAKTAKWKICILSPWAPSYNLFKNFEERGKLFKKLVLNT